MRYVVSFLEGGWPPPKRKVQKTEGREWLGEGGGRQRFGLWMWTLDIKGRKREGGKKKNVSSPIRLDASHLSKIVERPKSGHSQS